jgi:hypothetical protein
MTSGDATGICVGDPVKAWASNENIKTTAPQAKNEVIFDIDVFSFSWRSSEICSGHLSEEGSIRDRKSA